jgi:AcrR family transcriptional regulator
MTVPAITRLSRVGRWEPDAQGRLMRAALELYAERGFDQTTVADIAERAGVTERTFFRYFADKREALFDGAGALEEAVVDGIASAPAAVAPLHVVVEAFAAAASLLEERRDFARLRAAVVAGTPALLERELLKLAGLGAAAAEALRRRGVADPAAGLAAETGVTVFRMGFDSWIRDAFAGATLARSIRVALDQLRALTVGS